MNSWDKSHRDIFKALSHKMKFVPKKGSHDWHFELKPGTINLYFDELAFMIEYLQAIGEMRMNIHATSPRRYGNDRKKD